MVVFDSIRNFFDIITSSFIQLFEWFPELEYVLKGIFTLSLGYFGWRAIK